MPENSKGDPLVNRAVTVSRWNKLQNESDGARGEKLDFVGPVFAGNNGDIFSISIGAGGDISIVPVDDTAMYKLVGNVGRIFMPEPVCESLKDLFLLHQATQAAKKNEAEQATLCSKYSRLLSTLRENVQK